MGSGIMNRIKNSIFHGDYVGRDQNVTNIIIFRDNEREFVVTHNANIKPVSYFTGRETELQELRQRIEEGHKSVLVSGMGGIGKTHICKKLFEEYTKKHAKGENISFCHIGYIEYVGDIGSSLMNCLKYRQQDNPKRNQEAAWQELEYLASDGKLLLFIDNVNVSVGEDVGLERLKQIPGALVLTSRRISFSKEFEPYRIGFLSIEQCKEIYERIRYEDSGKKVSEEEMPDLEYIIENMTVGHTITIEFLAHLAKMKRWAVGELREELEGKGFQLEYEDEEDKLINIQEEYEKLYDLSKLTEAEQNILEAFSMFPYFPLGVETCNQWLLTDAGVSEQDDILMGLYQKGWLQFDIEQESYALHPVFAQFICEKCRPSLEWHRGLLKECLAKLKEIEYDVFWGIGEEFVLLAEGIAEKLDMGKSEEQIDFLRFVGFLLIRILKYEDAKKLYEKCIEICEEIFGEYHLDTAESYSDLADIYERREQDREAVELYEKSLRIRKNLLDEAHPDVLLNYKNLIYVYDRQGEYEKEERLYKRIIWVQEKKLGEGNPLIINEYYDLAYMKFMQDKYEEAEKLFIKAIYGWKKYDEDREVYIQNMVRNDVSISDVCVGLLRVYAKQERDEELQELFKVDWWELENVTGEKYPDMAINYSGLAHICNLRDEDELALSYAFKAYKIFKVELGINNQATKISFEFMEKMYRNINIKDNFERWLKRKEREDSPLVINRIAKIIMIKIRAKFTSN